MPTLTSTQLATARAYLGTDYANSDIVGYYSYLASQGVVYGDFAKAVVQNSTAEGKIANAYAASVALGYDVDLSVGSDDWKAAVFNVALEDIDHRDTALGADLTFDDYNDIHTRAFDVLHLPPETWTAHTPLTNAEHLDPLVAEANWNSLVDGSTSSISLLSGGLQLSLSALAVETAQSPVDFFGDQAAAAKWLANIAVALYVVGDTAVEDLIPTTNTQFWSDYNNLKDFFSDKFGANTPVAPNWMDGYLDPGIDPSFKLPSDLTSLIQPAFASAISASSPLVIDLSSGHTGVTLTSWSASSTETFFDLNDNGFAVQTAWISGDTGLLARDLNSNGTIDSSAELFGSPTVDGFAKLAALDSNHDLRIDNNDDAWNSLVVWTDDNGDAVTQSGELHSLSSLGIASIDLAGVTSSTSTISGNPISHTSKVTFTSGDTAAIDDAWFVHDNTNSYYTGDYTLDVDTLFLPALRGYGTLPDLTIAMSQDSDLKDMVVDLAENFTLASFADASALKSSITDILYAWAGVSDVDPNGRGINVDGQHLAFLEHLIGTDFLQYGSTPDPYPTAGALLETSYQDAYNMFSADLLLQVGAASLFADTVTFNPATGLPSGDTALSQTAIADLVDVAPAPGAGNLAFWEAIGRFIDSVGGLSNLTVSETSWLDDAVNASDSSLHWSDVVHAIELDTPGSTLNGTSGADALSGTSFNDTINGLDGSDTIHGNGGNDTINGGTGADTIYGDAGNDTIHAGDGDDVIYGGDGNDTLYGDGGNNTLDGGAGGNLLNGSSGNDTFVYSGGNDVISDTGGTDIILMPAGVTIDDLSFSRISTGNSTTTFKDLLITVEGAGTVQIVNQFHASTSLHVETIVFDDSSTLTLSSLAQPDVILTSGNDGFVSADSGNMSAYGLDGNDVITFQGSGAHILDGGAGNDTLSGGSGSDTYVASAGFDTISDTGGTDTILIPAAYDMSDLTLYRINNASGPTNNLGISIEGLGEIAITSFFANTSYAIENVHFLSDNSTITLTDQTITTLGTAGNDSLYSPSYNAGPNDIMDGREGNDTLYGGGGDDKYIFSSGHDMVVDTGGDDSIVVRSSYASSDISMAFVWYGSDDTSLQLTDTDGNTILLYRHGYSSANSIEHVVFSDTTWDLASMEIETHGTSGADSLHGHTLGDASSDDTIYGYGGNDFLYGEDGDDILYGGDGNDVLYGSVGNDILHGDNDNDQVYGNHHNMIYGDAGNDYLYNNASSGDAAITLVTMDGGDGTDTLYGGYGGNIMDGGAGADTLYGFSGAVDVFKFSAGNAFSGVDSVQQFNKAEGDKIDISDILEGHYDPATQALTDFVQIQTNGSNSELYVDTTGSGTFGAAQHIATISGVTGLTDEDALVTAGTLIAA
jgi:Ca2+-binding RTX toxin-like protein